MEGMEGQWLDGAAEALLEGCRRRRAAFARGDYGAAAAIARAEAQDTECLVAAVRDCTSNVALELRTESRQLSAVARTLPEDDVLTRADRCLAESRALAARARALIATLRAEAAEPQAAANGGGRNTWSQPLPGQSTTSGGGRPSLHS